MVPSKERIRKSWEKYGLIVVGNIVFFMLLYFISYRPHNEENRAAEFLSMAQQEETSDNWHTAMVLYQKVTADYPETRSADTAKYRITYLNKHKPRASKPPVKIVEPSISVEKMLEQKPAVYVAKLLAAEYDRFPKLQPKIIQTIGNYLKIAINYDGVLLKTLKTEKEFQRKDFQDAFFTIKPRCQMKSDWIYDDFFIKNSGIFPWHNVRIQVTVSQSSGSTDANIRIPLLRPGSVHELVSFRVSKTGGEVSCRGTVKSREGTAAFHNRL